MERRLNTNLSIWLKQGVFVMGVLALVACQKAPSIDAALLPPGEPVGDGNPTAFIPGEASSSDVAVSGDVAVSETSPGSLPEGVAGTAKQAFRIPGRSNENRTTVMALTPGG